MIRYFSVSAALALLLAASPAFACKGKTTMFSDDFREVDDSWGSDKDNVSVEDGRVKVKAAANTVYRLKYSGSPFDDADMCVTVRIPNDIAAPTESYGGIIFWAQDYSNHYVFQADASGRAGLWRMLKGKWVSIIDWRPVEGAKTGVGGRNTLRVVTKGSSIELYENDVKVASVKGQAPEGGGEIGLLAASEKTKRDAWKFSDLKVTKVEN